MMAKVRKVLIWLNLWRVLPAYLVFWTNKFKDRCAEDLAEWVRYEAEADQKTQLMRLGYFLVNCKECRNIFQNRLRR